MDIMTAKKIMNEKDFADWKRAVNIALTNNLEFNLEEEKFWSNIAKKIENKYK